MDDIKTPEELSLFMQKNIDYGYLGKNGKIYTCNDRDFDKDWYEEYILATAEQVFKNKIGNCFDQTEFEREWFSNNNYHVKTFFEMVALSSKNESPCHTFLAYEDKSGWNLFENADFYSRGIYHFTTIEKLLSYQLERYKVSLLESGTNRQDLKYLIIREFVKPKDNISASDYLDFVMDGKDVSVI